MGVTLSPPSPQNFPWVTPAVERRRAPRRCNHSSFSCRVPAAGKQRYMTAPSGFFDEHRNGVRIRMGEGRSIAQFGELFQGQTEREGGRRRCLVSLPCAALYTHARFHPDGTGSLRVSPPHKKKALRAMELTLARLGASDLSGTLLIESTAPEAKDAGGPRPNAVAPGG